MRDFPTHPGDTADAPRRRPVRRLVTLLLLAFAVGLIAALVAIAMSFQRSGSDVKQGAVVTVTIPKGASASDVATQLADSGVIGNRLVFLARARFNGDTTDVRAGTYRIKAGASYADIMAKLKQGPPAAPTFHIVFPEGFRAVDMARTIDHLRAERTSQGLVPLPAFTGKQYLAAVKAAKLPAFYKVKGNSKEGFLFPATYELRNKATAETLVAQQLAAFATNFDQVDMAYAAKHHLTPYDVTIIASMVEREAQLDKERPLVAAVIYNRLKQRMTLGIDATIQYAVSGPEGFKTSLTQSDLAIDSPYNTRTNMGLPPTPIANPGLKSLEAAAHPKDVNFLYYVRKPGNSGAHFFTDSFEAFNQAAANQ